jgi:hypothetical protein
LLILGLWDDHIWDQHRHLPREVSVPG